jgi:hypothetical protein
MTKIRLRKIERAINRLPSKCEVPPEIQAKLEEVHYKVNHNIPMNHISKEEAEKLVAGIKARLGL